jgi:GNAT superfamily N-acetyltransferase
MAPNASTPSQPEAGSAGHGLEAQPLRPTIARHAGRLLRLALVGTCATEDGDAIIAGGRYIVCDAAGQRAEVAFTVRDDYQGLGIAGRLLEHLVRIARDQGIAELVADVLPQNSAMLRVFARSGLPMTPSRGDGVVHVRLALA